MGFRASKPYNPEPRTFMPRDLWGLRVSKLGRNPVVSLIVSCIVSLSEVLAVSLSEVLLVWFRGSPSPVLSGVCFFWDFGGPNGSYSFVVQGLGLHRVHKVPGKGRVGFIGFGV